MTGHNKDNPAGEWWLKPIGSADLRQEAAESAESGDAGFLNYVPEKSRLEVVFRNAERLIRFGLYERALVAAFIEPWINNRNSYSILGKLFRRADRNRLLDAGDTLPGKGPFTLYRGVAGNGRSRHVRGWSWTRNIETAKNFAVLFDLPKPAVFTTTVKASDVLIYLEKGGEDEFIVDAAPLSLRKIWTGDPASDEMRKLLRDREIKVPEIQPGSWCRH
jgi:hypothetical protein